MSSYLKNRNGNYHLRVRIPSDLSSAFPITELIKTLKTRDKKTARVLALSYLQGLTQTFTLLRSGFITESQAQETLGQLIGKKLKVLHSVLPMVTESPKPIIKLSDIVMQFLEDRKETISQKTRLWTMRCPTVFS